MADAWVLDNVLYVAQSYLNLQPHWKVWSFVPHCTHMNKDGHFAPSDMTTRTAVKMIINLIKVTQMFIE